MAHSAPSPTIGPGTPRDHQRLAHAGRTLLRLLWIATVASLVYAVGHPMAAAVVYAGF